MMEEFEQPGAEGLKDSQNGKASLDDRAAKLRMLEDKFRHDIYKEYPVPETILSIGGQIWGTAGNF